MPISSILSSVLLAIGIASAQKVHEVRAPEDVVYEPNVLRNVQEGDKIRVTFSTLAHDIISGSWDSPCEYNSDIGLNSGVHDNGAVFVFTVNSTEPQVFFCAVGEHCQYGMALVVNPSGNKTLRAYTAAAKDTTSVGPESEGPEGGVLESAKNNHTSSTASESRTATASSASRTTAAATATESGAATETSGSSNTSSTEPGPAETTTAAGTASGMHSSFALVAALVAGAAAFAL